MKFHVTSRNWQKTSEGKGEFNHPYFLLAKDALKLIELNISNWPRPLISYLKSLEQVLLVLRFILSDLKEEI
jgi:hypothetical protein